MNRKLIRIIIGVLFLVVGVVNLVRQDWMLGAFFVLVGLVFLVVVLFKKDRGSE